MKIWYDKDALLGARDWANGVQVHQEKIREIIEWPIIARFVGRV